MGQAIVFFVSACWIAFAMAIAGGLLVRFAETRKMGGAVRRLAFVAYVVGFLGVAVIFQDMTRGGENLLFAFVLAAVSTGIPLVACSIVFYKLFRARKGPAAESDTMESSP